MTDRKPKSKWFEILRRITKDESGNTIIFIGAALIPLLAIIGGGVDASRGYMAKARLQQACDAATLAGRRAVGNGSFDLIAQQEADRLFTANFERGFLGSTNTTFTTSSSNNGNTVMGEARSSVPTVIMRIFGNDSLDLRVECQAALDIANADITMVLDTTGSMGFDINGNSLDPTGQNRQVDNNGNPFPNSRILSLRTATKSFFRALNTAANQTNSRVRYAFVPYSSTVNVGRVLLDNPTGSLILGQNGNETHSYHSREAIYEIEVPDGVSNGQSDTTFVHTDGSDAFLTDQACSAYGNNQSFTYFTVSENRATTRQFNNPTPGNPLVQGDTTSTFQRIAWQGGFRFPDGTLILRCTRRTNTETQLFRQEETKDPNAAGAEFLRWDYRDIDVPVSAYVNSLNTRNPVPLPTNLDSRFTFPAGFNQSQHVGNLPATVWSGCIEERDTIAAAPNQIRFSSLTGISPSGALDLNIDQAPTDDASRWRPYWPEITYLRANNDFTAFSNNAVTQNGAQSVGVLNNQIVPRAGAGNIQACPQPARTLSTFSETEFNNYIDSLRPSGGTYHDIGAIWGARLSSPTGIFADNVNETAPNNGFVSRNLIFLTDGDIAPRNFIYSAYGLELQSPNVGVQGTNDAGLAARHTARFLAICEAIKAQGTRVFVIAFGTGLSTDLQQCASVNSAFLAADSDDLNDTFLQIASNIADLRLTQ